MRARIPPAAAAALYLLALAIAAPAGAATITVANCNDHGTGSLRDAAALAQDGDVIDLRGLACSRVLLTSGPILFAQRDVTLQGPGRARLAIDGGGRSAVLRHPRGGLFRIRDLTVRWGRIDDPVWALGGCVYSGGNVSLQRVNVHHCVVRSPRRAEGGGVAAALDVRLIESHVYANRAVATSPDALALGGGTYSPRSLLLDRSRLCDNEAPYAGGGWVNMTATVRESTVSGNTGGGLVVLSGGYGDIRTIVERSTFSDNAGFGLSLSGGGVYNSTFSSNLGPGLAAGGYGVLSQNTIAFNLASRGVDGTCPGGFNLGGDGGYNLHGNVIAHNSCDGVPLDLRRGVSAEIFVPSEGNLIMYANVQLPEGTLVADPRLLPLANNGGLTRTHALAADSPAIDAGSEADVGPYDQRGIGYPRHVGLMVDIGAFERQRP